jgi:hypothetical protein
VPAAVNLTRPACGGLLENEVSRAEDPLLRDIELAG